MYVSGARQGREKARSSNASIFTHAINSKWLGAIRLLEHVVNMLNHSSLILSKSLLPRLRVITVPITVRICS